MNSSAFPGTCSARHNYCPPFRFFSRSPNIFPIFDDWKKGEKGGGNINVSIAILDVEISTIERRDGIFIVIIVIRGCHFLIEFH